MVELVEFRQVRFYALHTLLADRYGAALLDGVKVENDGVRAPLAEFATVSVKGVDLLVTLYDESVSVVNLSLYRADSRLLSL